MIDHLLVHVLGLDEGGRDRCLRRRGRGTVGRRQICFLDRVGDQPCVGCSKERRLLLGGFRLHGGVVDAGLKPAEVKFRGDELEETPVAFL